MLDGSSGGSRRKGLIAAKRTEAGLAEEEVEEMLQRLASVPEARAALAGAYADLRARQAGLPLAVWLARLPAGATRPDLLGPLSDAAGHSSQPALGPVTVSELITADDPGSVGEATRTAMASGSRCLKVKVAAAAHADRAAGMADSTSRSVGADAFDLARDVARVAAVRAAAGPGVELRLDANGGWPADQSARILDSFAEFDVAFCEEPTAGLDAITAVGKASSVPVAVDESARTLDDIMAALRTEVIAAVVVKPQALGGPDLALHAIELIRSHGAVPVVTTMIDSAIGAAHAVHVAAAAAEAADAAGGVAHGLGTSWMLADDVADPLPVVGGRIAVPAEPGLGTAPR